MPFTASWRTVLDECEELAADATLITPLSETRFRITDVQEHRIVIEFVDSGTHNHCNVSSSKRSPSGLLTPAERSTYSGCHQTRSRTRPYSVCIPAMRSMIAKARSPKPTSQRRLSLSRAHLPDPMTNKTIQRIARNPTSMSTPICCC